MSTSSNAPQGQLPPLIPVDDTHQQASVIIATSILLFAALLFVGARLWVRYNPDEEQTGGSIVHGSLLGGDDVLVVMSMVSVLVKSLTIQLSPLLYRRFVDIRLQAFYIVHCALISIACHFGLGTSVNLIPMDLLDTVQKVSVNCGSSEQCY